MSTWIAVVNAVGLRGIIPTRHCLVPRDVCHTSRGVHLIIPSVIIDWMVAVDIAVRLSTGEYASKMEERSSPIDCVSIVGGVDSFGEVIRKPQWPDRLA